LKGNKEMKKSLTLLCIAALLCSLVACSEDNANPHNENRVEMTGDVVVSTRPPVTTVTTPETTIPSRHCDLPPNATLRERMNWQGGIDATLKTHWQGVGELYMNLLMFRLWDESYAELFNMTFEEVYAENHAHYILLHELRSELTETILAYKKVWQKSSDIMQEIRDKVYDTWEDYEQAPWFFDIVGYFNITREELNRANNIVGELLIDEEIDLLLGDDPLALKRVAKAPLALLTEDGMLYSAEWLITTPAEEIRRAGVTTEMIYEWLVAYAEIEMTFSIDYEARFSEALSEFIGEKVSLEEIRTTTS
jgi:hypothetical protein